MNWSIIVLGLNALIVSLNGGLFLSRETCVECGGIFFEERVTQVIKALDEGLAGKLMGNYS